MTIKQRIERLEKRVPPRPEKQFDVDLDFRVAGKPGSWAQQEAIRRLRTAIADPRATDDQRDAWCSMIASIEPALRSQLESERECACPQCEWPLHQPAGRDLHKCQRCGCPVRVHGDGHVTDARPIGG